MKLVKDIENNQNLKKITDKEAEEAFTTILAWMGEDPSREGLIETPKRVVKAFKEYFKGYHQNAEEDLSSLRPWRNLRASLLRFKSTTQTLLHWSKTRTKTKWAQAIQPINLSH